jgi:drug/metabolite transporter (DMT)-like permease
MNYRESPIGLSPATVLFVLLAAFWGTSFVAIEVGLHTVPALSFAAMRYTVAGALIFAYATYTTDRWRPRGSTEWLAATVAGVLVIGVYHGALYLGELRVSGAVAAIVISLAPILTAAFASGLLGDASVDRVESLGLLLGLAGVVVIAAPTGDAAGADLFGVALVFLAAASFALGGVLSRPLSTSLPIETLEAWAMLVGSLVLWAGAFARGESMAGVEWTLPAVVSLVYLTLVSGCAGFLIYFDLLERIGATQLNLVGYAEPVVAALASWALLGHVIDGSAGVGFLAIFAGFALLKHDLLSSVATDTAAAVRSH